MFSLPSPKLCLTTLGLLLVQKHVAGNMIGDFEDGTVSVDMPVTYSCKLYNKLNEVDHPTDFPSNIHWSPSLIVSHSDMYSMWENDIVATPGVKQIAETGNVMTMINEIEAAGDSIGQTVQAAGPFFPTDDSQVQMIGDITLTEDHPYISAMSMIAPSPDWFSGFYNIKPVNEGKWMESFSIVSSAWDAGTDSGSTYTSDDMATDPVENISEIMSGVLLAPGASDVKPVAKWVCDSAAMDVLGNMIDEFEDGTVSVGKPVTYKCELRNKLSEEDHPTDFPSDIHWSPSLIVSHSDMYSMWGNDIMATPGVKQIAETGNVMTMIDEIKEADDTIGDTVQAAGPFFPTDDSQVQMIGDITLTEDHPYISAMSMIAPSPDWFSGFYNIKPVNEGKWMESFSIVSYAWDAGTDSGSTYTSDDMATDPVENISVITSGVLLAPGAKKVEPVANWACAATIDDVSMSESMSESKRSRRRGGKKKSKKSKKSKKKRHKRYNTQFVDRD